MTTLALVLACLLLAGPALASTWAQENADGPNHGRIDRSGPASLQDDRLTSLDGDVLAQVTEGPAGLALAGTLSGTVYALDADGDTVWQAEVDGEIRNAPLWTGEHVVVLPRGGTAHAFTAWGEPAWTVDVDNERGATVVRMASPVQHPSGDVILATMAGNVHRVDPDGSVVWTAAIGDSEAVEATPALTSEGDVIAAAFTPGQEEAGLLARIEAASGDTVWEREIGSQVVGAPTVVGDRVLVPLRDGDALESRSLSDGSQRWETAFDDHLTASPTIHEGLAIVGDIAGTVRALDVSGGRIAWSFHPTDDDPDVGLVRGAPYTVADSVAVDASGVAWTPYWVADLSTCCPPEDSQQSPIYRLDADDGELLDRQTHPKANHGPSLHASGVWAGSDEGGVHTWSLGSHLSIHADHADGQTHLLVNTDRSGDWRIAVDAATHEEGQGSPPATATLDLGPGQHTITVTVDGDTARQTLTIEDPEGDPEPGDGDDAPPPSDEDAPAAGGSMDDEGADPVDEPEDDPDAVSLPALAAVLASLLAAGVRARA